MVRDIPMDWKQFHELLALNASGSSETALQGLRDLLARARSSEESAAILVGMSLSLRNLNRRDEARRSLAQVYDLFEGANDHIAPAVFADACLDIDERDWDGALDKLNRLRSEFSDFLSSPENEDLAADVQRKLGIVLYERRESKEAFSLLKSAASREDEKETVLYFLGCCSYDVGDLVLCIDSLRQALAGDLDPVYQPSAHYVLGLAYHWRGREAWAVREFEWCIDHDLDRRVARWKLLTAIINSLKALGMEQDAERYSRELDVYSKSDRDSAHTHQA